MMQVGGGVPALAQRLKVESFACGKAILAPLFISERQAVTLKVSQEVLLPQFRFGQMKKKLVHWARIRAVKLGPGPSFLLMFDVGIAGWFMVNVTLI